MIRKLTVHENRKIELEKGGISRNIVGVQGEKTAEIFEIYVPEKINGVTVGDEWFVALENKSNGYEEIAPAKNFEGGKVKNYWFTFLERFTTDRTIRFSMILRNLDGVQIWKSETVDFVFLPAQNFNAESVIRKAVIKLNYDNLYTMLVNAGVITTEPKENPTQADIDLLIAIAREAIDDNTVLDALKQAMIDCFGDGTIIDLYTWEEIEAYLTGYRYKFATWVNQKTDEASPITEERTTDTNIPFSDAKSEINYMLRTLADNIWHIVTGLPIPSTHVTWQDVRDALEAYPDRIKQQISDELGIILNELTGTEDYSDLTWEEMKTAVQTLFLEMEENIVRPPAEMLYDKFVTEHPYKLIEKVHKYLYRVTFDELPEDTNSDNSFVGGGCSSFVSGGKLYRNLDWNYTEALSFHIVCPDFEGMAFNDNLTEETLDDTLIAQLPYQICDGRNSSGIRVSTHVLFNDWSWHGTGNTPLTKVPYLILSQITSLDNFATQMSDILSDVVATSAMDSAEYLLQFMVTDGTTTYAILPPTNTSGAYEVVDITANPKLANFRWVSDATVDRADLQTRPTGVERFNLMPCELSELRFTKAYENPTRLSEFIGIDGTNKDSTDEELTAIYDTAHAIYEERTRDGQTWQTMHSVVYSATDMEVLNIQEDFTHNYGSGKITPVIEAKNITENGIYEAPFGVDGYNPVTVNITTYEEDYNDLIDGMLDVLSDIEEAEENE